MSSAGRKVINEYVQKFRVNGLQSPEAAAGFSIAIALLEVSDTLKEIFSPTRKIPNEVSRSIGGKED